MRKRCDQKVVLEALSALSLRLDHFSAKADCLINIQLRTTNGLSAVPHSSGLT